VLRASPMVLAALVVASACAQSPASPLANVVLYVDTDAPVPKLASQLRVDLFTTDGTWYASRDVSAAAPSSWPVSFGVFLPAGAADGRAIVRLRAYAFGKVQDYRGYRYQSRPTGDSPDHVTPPPSPTDAPTLLDANGDDITPREEPTPALTIDRLVVVPLTKGTVGSVHVTLAGACFGTMADMGDFTALQTCVDTEAQLVAVAPSAIDPDVSSVGTSQQGAFEAPYSQPCAGSPKPSTTALDGTKLYDEDVCVVGGAFILGSRDTAIGDASDDTPERVALVPSFYMDKYEFTLARYHFARQSGLTPQLVNANDGPLMPPDDGTTACTSTNLPAWREAFPLTCSSFSAARASCRFFGRDLPREVEFEYAATMSGRSAKTPYPWGDATAVAPLCDEVVYSRGSATYSNMCRGYGYGPAPVTTVDHAGGDWSVGLHVVDLAGNVSEFVLDTFAALASDCWASATLALPSCRPAVGPLHAYRGGAWNLPPDQLVAATRMKIMGQDVAGGLGFRCVRPGGSGP
jgi:formylglycine-generating enzyme required for sulfatase activity